MSHVLKRVGVHVSVEVGGLELLPYSGEKPLSEGRRGHIEKYGANEVITCP